MAVVAVAAACTLVWSVLFVAFGTLDGPGDRARTLRDPFDRAAGVGTAGLGAPEVGPAWRTTAGTWAVADGTASVTQPSPEGRSIALVGLGAKEVTIGATAVAATPGWGLTFRHRDARNFWYVAIADQSGALHLGLVVDGQEEDLGPTGGVVRPGSKVEVRIDGHEIEVRLDGQFVSLRTDDRLQRSTDVGLYLRGADTGARWDDVAGGPLPAPTIVMPASGNP